MTEEAVKVFRALLKKSYIERGEDTVLWSYLENEDIHDDLNTILDGLDFELIRAFDRYYIVPKQENDLVLKNNFDFKKDINAANVARNRDLYLLNYLSIYIIYLFFGGEGANLQIREFISKQDVIETFTKHCLKVEAQNIDATLDYSENFKLLAQDWLGKYDGEIDSTKFDTKYGILNRLLAKYKTDELFTCNEEMKLRPTRRLRDLMPFFLKKTRISEIQAWLSKEDEDAQNQ